MTDGHGMGMEGRHVAMWESINRPESAGGSSAVATKVDISMVAWKALTAEPFISGENLRTTRCGVPPPDV
jgi:hypothetical protein